MKMDILYLTIYVQSECNKVKEMIFLQMGFVKHHNSIIRNGINDSQNVKPTFMEISQVGTMLSQLPEFRQTNWHQPQSCVLWHSERRKTSRER